jgi:hypothetical protein
MYQVHTILDKLGVICHINRPYGFPPTSSTVKAYHMIAWMWVKRFPILFPCHHILIGEMLRQLM